MQLEEQKEREKKREEELHMQLEEQKEREKKMQEEIANLHKQLKKLAPKDDDNALPGSGGGLVLASREIEDMGAQTVQHFEKQLAQLQVQVQDLTNAVVASHALPQQQRDDDTGTRLELFKR
jgi:hypothetical protein